MRKTYAKRIAITVVCSLFAALALSFIGNSEVKAGFNSGYAEVGKELKVVVDNALDAELTYTWMVDGQIIDNTTDTYVPAEEDLESFITAVVIPGYYLTRDDGNTKY